MDLEAYRQDAEDFLARLNLAYYRHYAGHDPDFALEPIYARYEALFTRDAVAALQEPAAHADAPSEQARRRRLLLDFALEGHIGQATKGIEERLAERELAIRLRLEGEERTIGLRESDAIQSNEPDRERREAIERARLDAIASELNGLHTELVECRHAIAGELGYTSYRDMCERSKAVDLGALHQQTQAFLAATHDSYPRALDPEIRETVGVGVGELRRSDLPRFFRAPHHDAWFVPGKLVESLAATLADVGVNLHSQSAVTLDLEARPGKTPRAFCAPVRIPGEVYLVLTPIGGREDYSILFHEAGHAQHAAHMSAQDPFEFRCLGDNSVAEMFAFLLEHVVDDPRWLHDRLGVAESSWSYTRANRLVYMRRYAAKLAYELELHGGDAALSEMPARYSELLGAAVGTPWPHETYLTDVDPGFYSSCYLRAWVLEAHLRAYLRERFGETWFAVPETGEVLRALWRTGMRHSPEELLGELTGQSLDFSVLLDDLALA